MIDAIGLDADDTLWENETFFRKSQAGLADLLAGYADPQVIASRLDRVERRNLARYGFGIKGFTLSMVQTAIELTDARIDGRAIARILEMGQDMLAHPVHLIAGVPEALKALCGRRLLLITKGDLWDQERKIAASGLADLFDAVEIVADKTPATYARLLARHGIGPQRFLMAGNSVKSDVLPVLELRGQAVLIPHDLTWAAEQAADPAAPGFHRLRSIAELPALVARIEAGS
ncbi:HAD family hydrolase [Paracoccus sp. (in: a-proteobacteria)]|uniref:HAD family hydrolase n=1 Tax=Paracoccus sp. TaxID=267 RepID=UPI003A8912F8